MCPPWILNPYDARDVVVDRGEYGEQAVVITPQRQEEVDAGDLRTRHVPRWPVRQGVIKPAMTPPLYATFSEEPARPPAPRSEG